MLYVLPDAVNNKTKLFQTGMFQVYLAEWLDVNSHKQQMDSIG